MQFKKPQFRIDLELLLTDSFNELLSNKSCKVYFFLLAYLVRGKVTTKLNNKYVDLYEVFYKNGFLVSKWTQKDIAIHLNYTQSTVSKYLTNLLEKGLIKTQDISIQNKKYNIYILGTISNHVETLFLEQKLRDELGSKEDTQNMLDKYRSVIDGVTFNLDSDFNL